MSETHVCPCGRPAPDTNLCGRCADDTRDRLLRIADRWPTLTAALQWRETPSAGPVPPKPRPVECDDGAGNSTGLTTNGQASYAMTKAASVVRYVASVLRDEYDDTGKPFNPPATDGSMDDIPKLARWIGMWHMAYLAHRFPDEGTVEAIRDDVRDAEKATFRAVRPTGEHWAPVNLDCGEHGTSDLGERIDCPGRMWAKVGGDLMPDLVCDVDAGHLIEPGTWERAGWKARLGKPLHPVGATRLLRRISGR